MRPLIAVEGSPKALEQALEQIRSAGWFVVDGWQVPPDAERVVCVGSVESAEDAARALLAVVAGGGLLVDSRAPREVLDRLYEDLRRLGRFELRTAPRPETPGLTREELALLELMLEGLTLGEAAARLHLSRRTADRRMASIRHTLGVATTEEALAAAMKLRFG